MVESSSDCNSQNQISSRIEELAQSTVLSNREAEFVAWKESGYTHQEIADKMGVKKGTIDTYAHRVKTKYEQAEDLVDELQNLFGVSDTLRLEVSGLRDEEKSIEKGDKVAYVGGPSENLVIQKDSIGEVVEVADNDRSEARNVLVSIDDFYTTFPESDLVEVIDFPKS